jgi:hypothetical protein
MTNVYYAVVNSTSCIKKEERRKKKQITFHIKSRFVDNFISENKVHVCKHFIYLFILFYFIYHIYKLVKGGFICKLFEDRWGIFFSITSRHFDIWRRSQFSVQYWTFFGTSIFGYIFLFFEVHRKRITNLKLM